MHDLTSDFLRVTLRDMELRGAIRNYVLDECRFRPCQIKGVKITKLHF